MLNAENEASQPMADPATRIDIAPHCALTPRRASWFFISLCALCIGVATAFAWLGFWPVLPFAGLELAVLGWALRASLQRRHFVQSILITDSEVIVEENNPKSRSHMVFPRHWAQVKLCITPSPLHPSRLLIESHGRRCEVGSFLNEQERRGLAKRLKRLIGSMAQSPSLPARLS